MVKLIHTDADLSVQVHPDDKYARKHENQYGKAECWYFADEPKNPIVLGHKAKTKEEQKKHKRKKPQGLAKQFSLLGRGRASILS